MTHRPPDSFVKALTALPAGTMTGRACGKRWILCKTIFNGGRSIKLVAEELGGRDYISFNLYHLDSGPALFPCEMSTGKVVAFLTGFQLDPDP